MQNTNVLIISKSLIVRKGIIFLLKETDNQINIYEIDSVNNLPNFLSDNRPEFIFISAEMFENQKIISLLKDFRIIIIEKDSKINYNELTIIETINYFATKEEIETKLHSIFSKSSSNKEYEKNDDLSAREMEIVKHVALGHTNQEIADKLFLSPHTVITHRKNITKKLGIKTVSGLTVFAILHNLISLDNNL